MHQRLHGNPARSIVVLHGLGGIGKTQLSIEYARRHREKFTAVLWLYANDEDSLKLSFRGIARQILRDHPTTDELSHIDLDGNLSQVVNAVKAWLELQDNSRWLMIYDNCDNPSIPGSTDPSAVDITRYLPEVDHGSIIVTTRSSKISLSRVYHIKVTKLSDFRDGLRILSNTSRRSNIENGKRLCYEVSSECF